MNFREQMVHSIVVESIKADANAPRTPKQFAEDLHTVVKNACQIAELAALELAQTRPKIDLNDELNFECMSAPAEDTLRIHFDGDMVGFQANTTESVFLGAKSLRKLAAFALAAAEELESEE